MPRKPSLRAVTEDEAPPAPRRRLTVSQAALEGSVRDVMVAMRDRIAVAVEDPNTPARDLAALTKRLAETIREIEAIDARAREDGAESEVVEDGHFDASAI